MTLILDGKTLRDRIAEVLKQEIAKLGIQPKLVILQVGDLPDSNAFIRQKKLFAEKIGAIVDLKKYENTVSEDTLISDIKKLNEDKTVHGIIIQLPIPQNLNKNVIIDSIHPLKDIDGLTATNVKGLWGNQKDTIMTATARGVISLLKHNDISIDGKKVVIVGRSTLVGKPLALAFLNENATVTICHRHTKNLEKETQLADILVIATGKTKLITKTHVHKDQIIVDVGINIVEGKMVGDVDFEEVKDLVTAISPVPGGVGPMTVASLFENLLDATKKLV